MKNKQLAEEAWHNGLLTTFQRFKEIWNGKNYQRLRQHVLDEPLAGFCRKYKLRYTNLESYRGSGVNSDQFLLYNHRSMKIYRNGPADP